MPQLSLARVALAVSLLAACSGADSTATSGSEQPETTPTTETVAMTDEGAGAQTTTLAAMARSAEAGMCELPSAGYAAACNDCLAARCCTQVEDCKSDAACSAQLGCIIECEDAEDPAECSMACMPEGVHAGYVAYDDCSFVECLSTCWM
jgi:hypothetical protein